MEKDTSEEEEHKEEITPEDIIVEAIEAVKKDIIEALNEFEQKLSSLLVKIEKIKEELPEAENRGRNINEKLDNIDELLDRIEEKLDILSAKSRELLEEMLDERDKIKELLKAIDRTEEKARALLEVIERRYGL